MKIENQDALKKWLVKILHPIFEGDSDKLALYIVALAKKVENDQPSRQRCIDDLEVFLESNTNSFVENFFDALFNKTYLQSDTLLEIKPDAETKPTNEDTTKKKEFDQRRLSDTNSRTQRSRLSRDYQEIDVSNRPNRASSHTRRRKNRSRTRTHGMSRSSSSSSSSPSPVRRSRSRSPFSRSRSRSPGQITETKKQRCKDFDEKGFCTAAEMCPYDHGDVVVAPYVPPGQMSINVQSSQYNSQFGQKRRIQMSSNKNGQQRFQKGGNFNQRNVNMQGNDNMYTPSPIQPGQQPQQRQVITTNRPRNLVSIVTSIHEEDTQDQSQQRGVKRTYNSNMKPAPSENANNSFNSMTYDVNNDQLTNQQQQQQQNIPQQQALLPTPNFMPGQRVQPQFQQQLTPQQQANAQNTTLILRRIPTNINTIDKLRQHFMKFGNIIDIQCHYDNLNDAALVKFSSNTEAFAAYKSPQPVFNNRFIRLYWLSSYLKQQQQQQQQQQHQPQAQNAPQSPAIGEPSLKRPAKERLSFPKQDSESVPSEGLNKENLAKQATSTVNVTSSGSIVKTVYASQNLGTELTKTSEELAKKSLETPESLAIAKQIQDENKKKALLLKAELQKKARELMEQQLKDQKILMAKLEQAKTVEEKTQILNLMKKLSEAIDKEKEILDKKVGALEGDKLDLESKTPASPTLSSTPFSFQKTSKPSFVIPPIHQLKINNKRLNTTSFLKSGANKLVNKPTSVSAAVISQVAQPSLYTYSRVSVDNRPKQLVITGVENQQEKSNIVTFITSLGCQIEAVNEEKSDSHMSLVINFVTRRDAEIALTKCTASLTSKKITISWYKGTFVKVEDEKKVEKKIEDTKQIEQVEDNKQIESKNEEESHENGKKDEVNDSLTAFLSEDKTDDNKPDTNNGQTEATEEDSNVFDSLFNDKE